MQAQVVFIDYLQLLADGKAKDRYQAITGISIALHELAQTTGILVVALAQLNRNAAHAAPSTADLRESGQLEQDGDAILLLSADKEEYQAILAKNKEGRVGEIPLTFDKPRQRFLTVTLLQNSVSSAHFFSDRPRSGCFTLLKTLDFCTPLLAVRWTEIAAGRL